MKRIRLHLTGVAEVITESAEKKLEKAEENILQPTCDNGRTMEDYENLNFPQDKIPKELIERQKEYELGVKLEDEDFEEEYSDISIFDDEILFKVTDVNGTVLFVKGGYTLQVLETVDEIDSYIEYQNLSWIEKLIIYIKMKFTKNEYSEKGY